MPLSMPQKISTKQGQANASPTDRTFISSDARTDQKHSRRYLYRHHSHNQQWLRQPGQKTIPLLYLLHNSEMDFADSTFCLQKLDREKTKMDLLANFSQHGHRNAIAHVSTIFLC